MSLAWTRAAIAAIAMLAAPACIVRVRGEAAIAYEVEEEPPARQAERPPAARPGYVWVAGHWQHRNRKWVWKPGHWERSRTSYVWTDGHWERRGNKYVWVEGHWSPAAAPAPAPAPAPVVRDHTPAPAPEPKVIVVVKSPDEGGEPPALQDEAIPAAREGFVWVRGRWHWNGKWEWKAGYWDRARADHRWEQGHWERRGDKYVWVEGRWIEEKPGKVKVKVKKHHK